MKKRASFLAVLVLIAVSSVVFAYVKYADLAYAQDTTATQADPLATDPSKCGFAPCGKQPRNCLFLEEPIGGKYNYDLFIVHCEEGSCINGKLNKDVSGMVCNYKLYNGGSVPEGDVIKQALLTEDPNKPYQGPFGLLYSYVQLIYAYMSGLIVGVSVLFIVISGIQMSMSSGEGDMYTKAKGRITKAIVGIIIWFTASLILYTINPTFFAF